MSDMSPSPDDLALLLTRVANHLCRTLRQQLRHECQEPRVTMPQIRVLRMASEGHPTLSDVASALQVTRPTATRLVDGLVQRGWIERRPDPEDRRRIRLYVTEAGLDVQRRVEEFIHRAMVQRLAHLAPEDMDLLYRGMKALEAVLTATAPKEG